MKKFCSLCLTLTLLALGLLPALAGATQTDAPAGTSFSGKVNYRDSISLLAPFGGQVEDYEVQAGDEVTEGDPLFTLSTTKVYAPSDGVVRGVRALPGDDAQSVIDRYGALAYIEPVGLFTVSGTTSGAYRSNGNGNVNRLLHEGETVYLRCTADNDRTGAGFITAIDGTGFTLEVTEGNLQMDDRVNIYRDPGFQSESRISSNGVVKKNPSLAILGEGSVLYCHVAEGDEVRRGDLLLETVEGPLDALQGGESTVTAPASGVVVEVYQAAGTTISKGDVLATLYAGDALLIEADITESDLDRIRSGDRVRIVFDAVDRPALEGTVESISFISGAETGDAVYTAYIRPTETTGLRVGLSVSVYTQ